MKNEEFATPVSTIDDDGNNNGIGSGSDRYA